MVLLEAGNTSSFLEGGLAAHPRLCHAYSPVVQFVSGAVLEGGAHVEGAAMTLWGKDNPPRSAMRGVKKDRVPLPTCRVVRTMLYPEGRCVSGQVDRGPVIGRGCS